MAEKATDLEWREVVHGGKPGDKFVRVATYAGFHRTGPGHLVTEPDVGAPTTQLGRLVNSAKRMAVGRPIPSSRELQERLSKVKGLAVFASDNISSSAYATEEIMRMLALAGALVLTMPLTLAIVAVLAIVVTSYQQTLRAYPSGGGSYIVASKNLGRLPGLVAAGALLTDYILTVSVSVAAGVAALTSVFPEWFDLRTSIGAACILLLMVGNLRGIRESGSLFAGPAYLYLLVMGGLLGLGLWRFATGTLPEYTPPEAWLAAEGHEALTLLLILRAFSSGAVALTGVEAVSNGVPAFKPPEARNAQVVLVLMGVSFATIFLGISFLAGQLGVLPDPTEQTTVISQITSALAGEGSPFHYAVQLSTALLLVLAANTAFSDFPRLAGILARDGFMPRQFQFRGDRLDFSAGIVLLAVLAAAVYVAFGGSVTSLIPLYTVGVFLAFTLSQTGMVKHWLDLPEEPGRVWRIGINAAGAIATGVVLLVVGVSKFAVGAWIVLLLIPALVLLLWAIRRHYDRLQVATVARTPVLPELIHPRLIVPVANAGAVARQALAFARAIAPDDGSVTAVHVTDTWESSEPLREAWADWQPGVGLVIIESPYRLLTGPLVAYVEAVRRAHPHDTITVVIPELVPSSWWEHLLHNQTALRIKAALLFHRGIVVVSVPYHLQATGDEARSVLR